MATVELSNQNKLSEITKPNTKRIWNTFWILAGVTAFEFLIAFTKEPLHIPHMFVVVVFVTLTLVKAFYIVAEFMHLAHEVKQLIWSILLPIIFVIWLIVALLAEGASIFEIKY
jgi:cytochrome c oxidase subunit IV